MLPENKKENKILESINDTIIEDIVRQGWSVQKNYLTPSICHDLLERLDSLDKNDALKRAGIGRETDHHLAPDIRRDKTFWLDNTDKTDLLYLTLMEDLRIALNRHLFLGLFEYEAHYAVYPAGGFYKKHVDAFKGEKNRLVSTVCYLNENWVSENGGQLAIYDKDDDTKCIHTVEPELGTLVVFLSEDIPHEVIPAHQNRKSIAGWFRCNNSLGNKINPLL